MIHKNKEYGFIFSKNREIKPYSYDLPYTITESEHSYSKVVY